MPLSSELLALAKSRRFWTDYFWITEAALEGYPQLTNCKIELPLPDGSRLLLLLDKGLCYFSLQFAAPSGEPKEIAWDDQAHWHPHVLRWQELEAVSRWTAIQDPEVSHPGILLLLLQRFAPICVGDDVDRIVAMLETAWRKLGLFSANEIREFIERADARDSEFTWQREESTGNWHLTQEEDSRFRCKALYTLRTPKGAFPFDGWRNAFEAAEIALRVRNESEETLGPRTIQLRQSHLLILTLPMQDAQRPLPTSAGYFFKTTLARLFESRAMGTADTSGAGANQSADGTYVRYEEYSVQFKGDLAVGLRLIREALWWARFPATTTLKKGYAYAADTIPLSLETMPESCDEICLQLATLRAFHWRSGEEKCFRLDRSPLSQRPMTSLKSALAEAGVNSPDGQGWYKIGLPDRGSMQVHLARNQEDEMDSVVVVFKPLSEAGVQFVHRLMIDCGFMLLPMATAASESVVKEMNAPWPTVRVVKSAAELFSILARGPFAWWSSP